MEGYKQLDIKFSKKGWDYELVKRGKKAVLYSATSDDYVKYEVWLIKYNKGISFGVTTIPPSERFPNDESFGIWSWCYGEHSGGLTKAMERFLKLEGMGKA